MHSTPSRSASGGAGSESQPQGRSAVALRRPRERGDALLGATLLRGGEVLDAVSERRGRVVDGQGFAGGGEVQEAVDVDALAGELVEVLRQLGGLVVALADVLDDAVGPFPR